MLLTEEELIEKYRGLVEAIAQKVADSRRITGADYEDLFQEGIIGMLDAAKRYDPESGHKFETFAYLRIRGAMVDAMRAFDPLSRSMRAENPGFCIFSEQDQFNDDNRRISALENVDSNKSEASYKKWMRHIEASDVVEALSGCWDGREKMIIESIYIHGKTMLEVSRTLGLSESRICQIHKEAMEHARQAAEILK
jgi:RNA polymerase sigma factor for flagellar operon FliA